MANNSDHKKPYNSITKYLPEVYRSNVNQSVFDVAFNRHLTKDDTSRVAGFIGQGNPEALVDRQVKEATPHRQAFQLAPTMYTRVGTTENALSFKAFQGQLSLMGVDISRLDKWGTTEQFNWAPPINLDMLINYQDYFWSPPNTRDVPEYITIENRCNKARSRVQSYNNILVARGSSFPITGINYLEDQFQITGRLNDLFVAGFVFFTDETTNPNLANKRWTASSSTYDADTNTTSITVVETIANPGFVAPTPTFIGQWWYDLNGSVLREWDGTQWITAGTAIFASVDLARQLTLYQYEANCACDQSFGWDAGEWDAGLGEQWDFADECVAQVPTPWLARNYWIHKTQVQSFADVKRAQLPIIEFNSTVELNSWTEHTYTWKYRKVVDDSFQTITGTPARIELEPVRGYIVANVAGSWTVFLHDQQQIGGRDINYTSTFVPGYKFKIVDDTGIGQVYTVETSQYREITTSDPIAVTSVTGTNTLCTVVTIAEATFASPLTSGTTRFRIEPIVTSQGDSWRGYHVHWLLDTTKTTAKPTQDQSWDYFLAKTTDVAPTAIITSTLPVHADDGLAFVPQTGSIVIGDNYQEQIIDISGVTRIDLNDSMRCIDGQDNVWAVPNSNDVRVYVNGERQYGNYTEITRTITAGDLSTSVLYTVVGQVAQTSQQVTYVQAVVFEEPLNLYDTVRIEVGCASFADMGYGIIPVRTVEDETQFTLRTAAGIQPQYMSLPKYQKTEQSKRTPNQYPLFNVFDVVTSEVVDASPIFKYREDSSQPINPAVGMRIVATADGREAEFEQTLLDRDNNILYGYRNVARVQSYWYSPSLNAVKQWDSRAWTSHFVVDIGAGVAVRQPIISDTEPTGNDAVIGAIWMDTAAQTLKQYDGVVWNALTGLVISDCDPTIQTVWKKGLVDDLYVPQYVDKNRQPVANGDPLGDWEVVDQWRFNPQHNNKQYVSFTELLTHFRTILESQDKLPGLQGGGVYTLTQNQFDYGRGGTIKEHNDSFDTLISAVNVINVTPVGVMEFAAQQYSSALLFIRELFNSSIDELLTSYTPRAIAEFDSFVADTVIGEYEQNDFTSMLFGDTTAYDPATGKGIRNWIATGPMFGLAPLYRPHLTTEGTTVRLYHHDGHRSDIRYTGAEIDRYARQICNRADPRLSGGTFGKISSLLPPATETLLVAELGFVRPVMYWYTLGANRQLYRLAAYSVSAVAPSFFYEDGVEIPDGTMYYNTTTEAVYRKTGLSWVAITTLGAGNIQPLWQPVNIAEVLGQVQLEVETRLFDVTTTSELAFDYDSLTATPADEQLYQQLLQQRFAKYVVAIGDVGPFVNTEYSIVDAYTWNYSSSTITTPPRVDVTPSPFASWQALYTHWYGTPYPHLEPWKLQGFNDKPTWWDEEYLDTTGTRRWIYNHSTLTGMWENIRTGVVPAGRTYPSGAVSTGNTIADGETLSTYSYMSVNISDSSIPGGYGPDNLLPPYYDNAAIVGTLPTVRSLFNSFTTEITAPEADYTFGDVGPTEWMWSVSGQYLYDRSVVAFLMEPAKFLHHTFGPQYINVDGLQVDRQFKQVYSHADAYFHGDIYDTNQTYAVNGLNQWYVNYNRSTGYDTNGEFRQLWAGWTPRLTYQFAGIVDTGTFEIANKYFDVINQDYGIVLANNGVIRDIWIDAFEASLLSIPPAIVQYNNQSQWKIELDTLSSTPREIPYYGTKSYAFVVDVASNTCTAFAYPIVGASSAADRFLIAGDQDSSFTPGTTFTVTGGPNAGTYTVSSTVFETSSNRTRINVVEPVPADGAGGVITLSKALPWVTGDQVIVSSTKFIPAPLQTDTAYYIIALGGQTFRLAESRTDAIAGAAIDLINVGDGTLTVSQITAVFNVFGGQGNSQENWYHYALDKTDVRTFLPPYTVLGMQTFINLIDGYAAYAKDTGQLQNIPDAGDFDPDTGRLSSWEVETERFIDWAYGLRRARITVADRYPVTVNPGADTLTFGAVTPSWLSGTAVTVISSGELPTPLVGDSAYYIINTGTPGVVQLSTSASTTDLASIVDLTSIGSGQVSLALYNKNRAFPRFELNSTRYNAWIDTPLGVLSDVIAGPYDDIRLAQTIFDQYGRPMESDKLTVFRQDRRSHIAVRKEIRNDVDPIYQDDPYNYIHLGGAHLFIEGYEHFLIFNNYTVGGNLLYDPFLGLQATKFAVDYFEKTDYTLRPTLGGYYLLDQQFHRNMEGATTDLRNIYDVMSLSENSEVARRARALIGYKGNQRYLDFLNINSKSQFLFYQGMIQSKGSVNSVKAYINSRRFVDAQIDEFWAWKVAEFGDARQRIYPEIKLFSTDGAVDDVRLEFLATSESPDDDDVIGAINKGFQPVTFKDSSRWNLFPEQKSALGSPLFLDTAVSSLVSIFGSIAPPPPGAETAIDYWYNPTTERLFQFDSATQQWDVIDVTDALLVNTSVVVNNVPQAVTYFKLPTVSDAVKVIRRAITTTLTPIASINIDGDIVLTGDFTDIINVGVPFGIVSSDNNDGYYYPQQVTLSGSDTIVSVGVPLVSGGALGVIQLQDFTQYAIEVYGDGTGLREFTRVNSEMIRFSKAGVQDILQIFCLNPAFDKQTPARLVDVKAQVVVQDVPMWDPARGQYSPVAAHNVDLFAPVDPARYTVATDPEEVSENNWNVEERGTVWLDTSTLGYLPYYDNVIFPDVNDRLYNWGKLAPWASVNVYQWIESPVPPEEWDAYVDQQAADTLIPQSEKASGTPRRQVFKRTRTPLTDGVGVTITIDTSLDTVTVTPSSFEDGEEVLFTTTGTLPGGITEQSRYIVANAAGDTFQLYSEVTETIVDLTTVGTGTLTIVPAFKATDWAEDHLIVERILSPVVVANLSSIAVAESETVNSSVQWPQNLSTFTTLAAPVIAWSSQFPDAWTVGGVGADTVTVYIDGVAVAVDLPVQYHTPTDLFYVTVDSSVTLNEFDVVDVVRPVHTITDEEAEFDPDVADDGSTHIQWKEQFQYSTTTVITGATPELTETTTRYYFWTTNSTSYNPKERNDLSTVQIAQQFENIPSPYFVVQRPKDDPYLLERYGFGSIEYGSIFSSTTLTEADYQIPVLYREAVIRKIASYINDDDRYIIRFTRDGSLRDRLETADTQFNLKNKHEEWFLFRREQNSTLPRELWDKLTEALAGYKLNDRTVRVPSLERELYDATFGTDTRYGIGADQAFVDRQLGIATVLAYLTNPQNNFAPTDIDAFLSEYSFDTPDNIVEAMNAIYISFNATHVNAIWFETLHDALSLRTKYRDIMKTSWVALHGIRVLEVGGLFDD